MHTPPLAKYFLNFIFNLIYFLLNKILVFLYVLNIYKTCYSFKVFFKAKCLGHVVFKYFFLYNIMNYNNIYINVLIFFRIHNQMIRIEIYAINGIYTLKLPWDIWFDTIKKNIEVSCPYSCNYCFSQHVFY